MSNFGGGGQQQGAPKTKLDDPKLKLYGVKQNGSKGTPTFQMRLVNNNPRVQVVPNIGTEYEPIHGAMDSFMFGIYMDMFDMVFKSEGKVRFDMELKDKPWDRQANKRSENIIVKGTLSVGRDDKGIIYTCFLVNNKPKCKFEFKLPMFADIRKASGEEVSDVVKSEVAARSWKGVLERTMIQLMATNYTHRTPQQQGGGNNFGGNKGGNGYGGNKNYNNNNGGNGGGGWKDNSSGGGIDDDVDF